MSQLSYSIDTAKAVSGMLADGHEVQDILSRAATEALPFGRFITHDTAAPADYRKIKLPTTAAEVSDSGVSEGIAMADTSREFSAAGWAAGDAVMVGHKGRFWVAVEDVASVAKGLAVSVRYANGDLGASRAVPVASETELHPIAKFTGKVDVANSLAVIEL